MVLLQKRFFQITSDANLVKVFRWVDRKKQNGDCGVGNFRRFVFGMSLDVPPFIVRILSSDFKFWIGVNKYINQLITKILNNVVAGSSLVCVIFYTFNLHLEEWAMKVIMVSKIWVGMSTNNIHLLQFKIQGHVQKWGLWMPVSHNSLQGKLSKFWLHRHFDFFPHQNTVTKLPSWVLWSLESFLW